MSFLLEFESLAEILQLVVGVCNSLVARYHLDVLLSKDTYVSKECLHETVDGSLEMLEVLVHQTQVKIQCGYIGVILSCRDLQDRKGSVHVLECP